MTHRLKTWPSAFAAVARGDKCFEVRKNDRDFEPGDLVCLVEWNPGRATATGRVIVCRVGYLVKPGPAPLAPDVVVFGLCDPSNGAPAYNGFAVQDVGERLNEFLRKLGENGHRG